MAAFTNDLGVEGSFTEKLRVSKADGGSESSRLVRVEQYVKTDEDIGKVRFLFWFLQGSLYVWIGLDDQAPKMPHLVMGGVSRQSTAPLATSIARYSGDDEMSQNIAKRCALKTGKVVFVTCTLKDKIDQSVSVFATREIIAKINESDARRDDAK